MTALGITNRNPLNIRYNPANKWIGQGEPNGGFCTFDVPASGIRAGAVLIQNHYDKRGADTIAKLIDIWAPPNENDTDAYAETVAQRTGFGKDEQLDFHSYEHVRPVIEAMIRVECGQQPYSDAIIDTGLARAGIAPAIKPTLQASRTIKAAQIGAGTTIAGAGVEAFKQAADQALDWMPIVQMVLRYSWWIVAGVALASFAVVAYARWDDRRRGLR